MSPSEPGPSAAPVRPAGTRARSGNAMLRTRAAILAAALRCVERQGVRRTTMSDIAGTAGVAKATLYNHFRTKDDVLVALVESTVLALADRAVAVAGGTAEQVPGRPAPGSGLADALVLLTGELADAPALRRLAADEPALLVRLVSPAAPAAWMTVRDAAARLLTAAGLPTSDLAATLVLRHLVHHLVWPSTAEDAVVGAELLSRGLRALRPVPAAVAPQAGTGAAGGLGWPS